MSELIHGVPLKLVKKEVAKVHRFLKERSFKPVGHDQHGNMPIRPPIVNEDDFDSHYGVVILPLRYVKTPNEVCDCWYLNAMPDMRADVYLTFKVNKTRPARLRRVEVVLMFDDASGFYSGSGYGFNEPLGITAIAEAYQKPADQINRLLERKFRKLWA